MTIEIVEESSQALPEYAKVSIAFLVESQLRVEAVEGGLGGLRLIEEKVNPPYIKDYDREKEGGPERWPRRWDMSNWGILSVFEGAQRVGGAAIAWRTPRVNMLEGRDDLAVLWDIRVRPEYRAQGIGSKLFSRVVDWAKARGCRQLKIETQNINVPACRFYARQGCELGAIRRWAYPSLPQEVQLLWYLNL
jgi:GNAT superfamily N-acetyltransferase